MAGNGWLDSTDRKNATSFGGNAGGKDENGVYHPGGAQEAANGYQSKANDMGGRQAYQLDYGQANADRANAGQARNSQQDALGLQQQAAMGTAPSRAETMGRGLIDQGLQSQLAGASSAHGGPLAQMAAQRNAQQGAAAYTQQGTQGLAAMRAGEMSDARNAYMQGASGIRGQDYAGAGQAAGMAQAQGSLEMGQRGLNQSGQMGYDQMGYNAQNDQANRNVQEDQINSANWKAQMDANAHRTDANTNILSSAVGAVGSGISSLFSDEDAKVPVFMKPGQGGGDASGALDIGDKGGFSSGDVLMASTGKTGNAMQPVGGGGLVGGSMPASTMGPSGGGMGGSGVASSFGKGFANFGKSAHLDTSDENAKDVEEIRFGRSNRGDPQFEAMLDDRHNTDAQRHRPVGNVPTWLDKEMHARNAPPPPIAYGSKTEKGVAGAPKGYAADRARHPGSSGLMWGDTAQKDADRGVAPGTTDDESSKPKGKEKPLLDGASKAIGGAFDGFGKNAHISYSDENAKKAAFDAGHEAGKAGVVDRAKAAIWHEVSGDPGEGHTGSDRMGGYANKVLRTGVAGLLSGTPAGTGAALGLIPASVHPQYAALKMREDEATPVEKPKDRSPVEFKRENQPPGVSDGEERLAGLYTRSDEDSKEEPKSPVGSRERAGGRDPQSFKRDTPADQKRVKRAYEDKAGHDADDMMLAYGRSLDEGPSARRLASGSKENNYETELTSGAEKGFRNKFGFPESKDERVLGRNTGTDYDLRGAFARGNTDGQRFTKYDDGISFPNHLPDTFKKPNHATFSVESQYAGEAPEKAGRWQGDQYIAPEHVGAAPGEPDRERTPNERPYQDPDGHDVGDEDFRTYDDDNVQARRGGEMHQFKAEKGAFPDHIQEDANRRMVGFPYAYKDGFRPPEQGPGELNYGFSAQQLEKNPITATAVKKDANGMRQVDMHKLAKAQGASIASLQDQIDQMKGGRHGR